MDETVTKRLHVSGLMPSITPADLSQRLGTFGTVKALDGFGLLDGVGQPRKFAYVTLETTKKQLGRCMNSLNGVTWKGAKLRIGEAKPDFRERIAKEHESLKRAASDEIGRPSKQRRRLPRGVHGVYAADMSLVTPENVSSRGGWKVTALGRIIHPVRMRPTHPLPELPVTVAQAKEKNGKQPTGKKRRLKQPPTRARRRTIDPTKWGSQHLKGVFLENSVLAGVSAGPSDVARNASLEGVSHDSEEEEDHISGPHLEALPVPRQPSPVSPLPPVVQPRPSTAVLQTAQDDLLAEKQKSLGLLQALFGDKGDEEWGEAESFDSDIEMNERRASLLAKAEDRDDDCQHDNHEDVMDVEEESTSTVQAHHNIDSAPLAHVQTTKLKDLFAPQEENAGFSLLGHLDLDLELDDEVDAQIPVVSVPVPQPIVVPVALPASSAFNPKQPLFFPLPSDEANRGRARDAIDPTDWRSWFFRTDSEEDIQKRWEGVRGELTSGWKRRHREAIKSRRRRGGGPGDADLWM